MDLVLSLVGVILLAVVVFVVTFLYAYGQGMSR